MDRSGIVIAIVMIGFVSAASSIEDNKLGSVIGIYFGTSSYRVGVYVNGHFEIIPNDEGNRITPSWVAFTDSETLIGEAAKNQAALNPQRTIFDVKRLVGREFEDKEVQRVMKAVPYKIVNKDGKPYIKVGETKVFSPVEISAMILTKAKERAEAFLGKKITDAVVPVPSYFNDEQMEALMDACLIAGLVIEEQIAVAHAYGLHEETADKHILMFQLGEGAFDVTMLEIAYGGLFDYRATAHLGGEEYDERIMEYLIKLTKNKYGQDVSKDKGAFVMLRMEAKRAKRDLSNQNEVVVNLFDDVFEPLRFEELNNELLTGLVKKAIEDARLEKHRIEDIIVLGGNNNNNTRKVQQLLRDYFNGRVEPKVSVNPDDLVVIGAAVAGDLLVREPNKDSIC